MLASDDERISSATLETNWMRQGCELHDHSVTLIQLKGKSIPRTVEIHQISSVI
jgi:hypothetical protein